MRKILWFLVFLIAFLIPFPAVAQVQVFNVATYSTPEAAVSDLPYLGKPIALVPSYVRHDGQGGNWDLMSWTVVYAPFSYGNTCEIYPNNGAVPVFGSGGPCFGSGLGGPQTVAYATYAAASAAFMSKTPLQRQSCVIVAEPGQQMLTWTTTSGEQRYWLTCQEGFVAYIC